MSYTSSVLPHQRNVDTVQVTHVDYPDDDPFIINKSTYLANKDDYELVGEKQGDDHTDDPDSDHPTDSNQENPDSEPKQRKTRTRKTSKSAPTT